MSFLILSGTSPPATPGPNANLRSAIGMLFFSDCLIAVCVLIVLGMLARPYPAIKARADLFHAATNCASIAASEQQAGPCSIAWANVVQRYFHSHRSSKAGTTYTYYLRVRGGYGDMRTVELSNADVWWRINNGIALKLQRWGDDVTAVGLPSGESSPTAENPEWQLANNRKSLRVLAIVEIVLLVFAGLSFSFLRALPQ